MRALLGAIACAIYGWRVYDPKGSYAAFYDASNWLTGQFLADDGPWSLLRNLVNLILLDQADGFLLGIAFFALLSLPLWGIKVCGRWCVRAIKRLRRHRHEGSQVSSSKDPLVLQERVKPSPVLRERA